MKLRPVESIDENTSAILVSLGKVFPEEVLSALLQKMTVASRPRPSLVRTIGELALAFPTAFLSYLKVRI